jgi:hypothetical protein
MASEVTQLDDSPFGAQVEGATNEDPLKRYPDGFFVDEQEMISRGSFPIAPKDLIERAKSVLRQGVHRHPGLASNFTFSAPFIGPMGPDDFRSTMETLNLEEAFPGINPRYYHFRVDPFEPERVWFTTRPVGRHDGVFQGSLPSFLAVKPTHKVLDSPPQTASLSFNEQGQVTGFTMGYVQDRRLGNTGGLGGTFGMLWVIGCPFPYPEGKPWAPSLRLWLFQHGGKAAQAALFLYDRLLGLVLPHRLTTAHARGVP